MNNNSYDFLVNFQNITSEMKITQKQRTELLSSHAIASCPVEHRTNLVCTIKARAQWNYFI